LAPFLFIVVLDHALRLAVSGREEEHGFALVPRRRHHVRLVMITDLDFADDIALISDIAKKVMDGSTTGCGGRMQEDWSAA